MNGDYQPFSDTLEWVRKAGHVCDYSVKGFAVDSDRWHHQTRPNCIFPHEMWVQGHFGHFNVKSSIFMRSNFRGWNMNFCQIMICWYVNSLAYFMPKNSRKLNHHENKWFHIINISPRFVNDFCIMCKNNLKQIIYLGIYNLAILHFSQLVNNVWTFLFFIYLFLLFLSVFFQFFFNQIIKIQVRREEKRASSAFFGACFSSFPALNEIASPFGFSITLHERVIWRCKQAQCLENWKSFNFSVD